MFDPEGRASDPVGPPAEPTTEPIRAASSPPGHALPPPIPLLPITPVARDPIASGDWPAVAYWAALRGYPVAPGAGTAPPADWRPEPPPPTWTRTYELPGARKVVSAGLQLAVASSKMIRQASIYVGLLSLGAFGPAAILLLLGLGRLATIPETSGALNTDPTLLFFEQPGLVGPLVVIYVLGLLGVILLVAISIDAQAMAIALLGGVASERPLDVREALARARQTFWRLAGAGFLVGLVSGVVTAIVLVPFSRPFPDTNEGLTFIASIIASIAVVPFAYASAGIVLGDVSAMEALRRSVALFKSRKRIAVVVSLFTLVTSAIQTFALLSGLDIATRVAEFLHLGVDQGGLGLVLPILLVLAFIVAFGSLTFTIAAIVAAPQVAGFLGLTFFSGGLDLARAKTDLAPGERLRRPRWVSLPMLASITGLALIAVIGLPTIYGFVPRPASPVLALLRDQATLREEFVSAGFGSPVVVEDPELDHGTGGGGSIDILAADVAGMYAVPAWLLDDVFKCDASGVACGTDRDPARYEFGAMLFAQQMAGAPPQVPGGPHMEWGPMVALDGYTGSSPITYPRFGGATDRFSTELDGERLRIRAFAHESSDWIEHPTAARSALRGDLLYTLVPWDALPTEVLRWDAYASFREAGASGAVGDDNIRLPGGAMRELPFTTPWYDIYGLDLFAFPTFAIPSFEP